MAVKRIFVRPGDLVQVYVVDDPEFALTKPEWDMHKPRPFMFSFTPERYGVTVHDPNLDVGVQMSSAAKRVVLTPHAELRPTGAGLSRQVEP